MIRGIISLGIAAVLTLATAAHAETDYAHQGPYVQLSGLLAVANGDEFGGDTVAGGLSAKVGIDIVDYVSMEIQFDAVPDQDLHILTFQQRTRILTGRWQPFVLGGIGWGKTDFSSHFAVRVGGGLDYMINEHLSAGIDATYVFLFDNGSSKGPNFGAIGLGVRYGF